MKQGLLTGVEASQIFLLASKEAIDGRKPLMAEGINIENINLKGGKLQYGSVGNLKRPYPTNSAVSMLRVPPTARFFRDMHS
jgi:hypothetical protein